MPKLKTVEPDPIANETLEFDPAETIQRPRPHLAGPDEAAAISPALSLQQMLIDGWEEGLDDGPRWPMGLTIALSVGCALALWALIFLGAASLFHLRLG